MQDVWRRIETWLAAHAPDVLSSLGSGATDADIADAENELGVRFPDDVRASYLIHDGQSEDYPHGIPPGFLYGWDFLSLDRIRDEWRVWKGLLDADDFEQIRSEPQEGIRDDWWNPKWIPLTADGAGDSAMLDLDPAPGGVAGQVIQHWHDAAVRELLAPSYRAWLETFAEALEAGEYVFAEEFSGLVHRDEVL